MTPEYMGDLWRLAWMISAVLGVVKVMWQGSWPAFWARMEPGGYGEGQVADGRGEEECSTWNSWDSPDRLKPGVRTAECSTWNKSSCQNENQGTDSSPGWASVLEKSIERF